MRLYSMPRSISERGSYVADGTDKSANDLGSSALEGDYHRLESFRSNLELGTAL